MEKLLQVRDARYCYDGTQVLAIPALDIFRATIIGLAGPNGSGKTTLLKLLSCVEKPTSGSVCLVGGNASTKDETTRHRLCLLPQKTYLLKRTVFENVAYGLRIRGQKEGFEKVIGEALELVGLPQSFAGRQWHELSGGEAQRVALAARLVLKPDCLLLDEPTASVDMESARCIRRAVLLARREWGTTLIIASHHRSWLNDICDRIVYLYNGRILDCSYENILTGPWERVDNTMVACKLSDGQKVYAVKPPATENNAVIAPEALQINSPPGGSNIESFQGVVTSMMQDSHTVAPQVYISCGDQRILVNISAESMAMKNIRPGQQVTLHYNPEEIIWLEKE